uniref:Flap endonuclease GEN-like 1 n=2 Tax=Anthurium amnicola TaxID=1678845 RepID=A0A1D1YAX4_9ARAE
MGVGGKFWDVLKPYARSEGMDFVRDKRVAVDLSFWIVQHDSAIRGAYMKRSAGGAPRNPHIRVTFFRTVNLFAKMGAYPVFVVDGEPPRMKAQARVERFCRASGLDPSALGLTRSEMDDGDGPVVQRNRYFTRCVQECVELLELLGMPILRATSEAEALCAQLNIEGQVDACITADSDAFLFGAKCVIKCLHSNSKEPFECYNVADIEAGLGLRRKHLLAISLLVGNDYDLHGVPGIGVDTAIRFVQLFKEDEILHRLGEIGKGNYLNGNINFQSQSGESSSRTRSPHCSNCGHPGSKRIHLVTACVLCNASGNENCAAKPAGFKCECSACAKVDKHKLQKKQENWRVRVCQKISTEQNFPNDKIIEIYLNNNANHNKNGLSLLWENPEVDALVDFMAYYQNWKPSYTRQRLLPMLTTIFLREMASNPKEGLLLCGQYEFHSIQRMKIRFSHPFCVVKWKRVSCSNNLINEQPDFQPEDTSELNELNDLLDEPDVPLILIDDGCWFMATDEHMELVKTAFPKEVDIFLKEKELKESKSRRGMTSNKPDSSKSTSVQLSITEFYRSSKIMPQPRPGGSSENVKGLSREKQKMLTGSDQSLSKSARRRRLFG